MGFNSGFKGLKRVSTITFYTLFEPDFRVTNLGFLFAAFLHLPRLFADMWSIRVILICECYDVRLRWDFIRNSAYINTLYLGRHISQWHFLYGHDS